MTNQPRSTLIVPVLTAAGALVVLGAIAFLVASGGTPAATIKPSSPPVALASRTPTDPSVAPVLEPSAPPSATPRPTAKPTPKPPPVWSKPTTIAGLDTCSSVVATIDARGIDHVAATCDGTAGNQVRYAVSSNGRTWHTTTFTPPSGRFELDPQLAFAGDTLYVAYTRVAPTDGGCGDDGLADVGVYYRTRTLPSGAWSEPTRLGLVGDHLQSFRVNGSVIHATVANEKDGKTYYEALSGATLDREDLGVAGLTSLRVGDDGKARIAYASETGIEIATGDGSNLSAEVIPGSKVGSDPTLVLAPGNDAYVLWTRSSGTGGGGCADMDGDSSDGTYFATNASGKWVTSRLTSLLGGTSMALDPVTGEIHVLVDAYQRIVYFHRSAAAGSAWAHETLVRGGLSWAVIREDPASGDLLVVFVTNPASESDVLHVQVMTRH
ncbi:MAG: hypothetical protein QOE42_518 [Chloroflexota bacterium]|nr:hypothetical protein [Chloroflexota bacterium]